MKPEELETEYIEMIIDQNHPAGRDLKILYKGKPIFCISAKVLFDWKTKDFVDFGVDYEEKNEPRTS